MHSRTAILILACALAIPAAAQEASPAQMQQHQLDQLAEAQATLRGAEQAGAQQYAKSLYDEASYLVQFAQQNWNAARQSNRDEARMRAVEGLWAASAALAKARWIGTNSAVRSLQDEISRLGGTANVSLNDESPDLILNRGTDSRARIAYAQGIIDSARSAGGDQVASADLATAQANLESARKITRVNDQSETADYLSYVAEMMARRAYYMARSADASKNLAPLQLRRTELAQSFSERQAAAERAQREQAEREREALQTQLAAEQANRQAQAAELERLRSQLEENRRAMVQKSQQDRAARTDAERQVDDAFAHYEATVATGSPADIETARRQLEDAQIALRAAQQREQYDEQAMSSDIDRLRNELTAAQQAGSMSAEILSQRQAEILARQQELDSFRQQRTEAYTLREQLEQRHTDAIAAAQKRRADAEAQALLVQQQLTAAQQAAEEARAAADSARQQADETRAELEKTRAETQQAQTALQNQQQATQAELERTRQQLAERDAETQRLRMEQELARIAATRNDERGFVITLSSALFDTGKATLKPGAKATLRRIADQLKTDGSARLIVEGHTDNVGSEAKNLELSRRRAEAVRDFLVSSGISPSNITAAGKGESEPVATNKTVAGRQQNRRVELIVTKG